MDTGGITRVSEERLNQTEEAGILKPFAYHKPSDDGLQKITQLRKCFSDAKRLIEELCPNSRERSHTFTLLEDTAMWAIKAVVINDPKSEALQ